jgi:exopolysaccharide biosynthesis polyprenyl glycosylphosphotransferase
VETVERGAVVDPPPALPIVLPPHDVRAKRPPVLGLLLRLATLREVLRVATLVGLDAGGLVAAITTALVVKAAWYDHVDLVGAYHEALRSAPFAVLVCVLLFARSGLYGQRAQRPGLARIASGLFQTMVIALIFALVQGQEFSSYWLFYGSLAFALVYIGSLRWAYERVTGALLRAAGYRRRALLVGTGEHIDAVAEALQGGSPEPVETLGYVSLTPRRENGLRSLGPVERLPDILREHRVDEVIIADPDFPQARAVELVDLCHGRGVVVRVAPSTMEILMARAELVPGQSVPLFELKPPVFEGFDYALKRGFDLVVASLLLIVLAPVLAALALAIKASSRGPALYASMRPGIGGTPFPCLKFRTMYSDADQRQADLESLNEATGALFKMRRDPRVTPVGSVLRRFSLDELPQLLNVLRGEMSLVGPRPLPQRDFDRLEDWHKKRYLVTPGITGLWQVSGRSELDFDDLVRLDFLYLERWSVFLDLTILLRTVPAVLSRRGAF